MGRGTLLGSSHQDDDKYTDIVGKYNTLNGKYTTLNNNYTTLNGNYTTLSDKYDTLNSQKVPYNWGSDNSGKFLVINSEGNVEARTIETWNPGKY